jgi:hypothetical protein
MLYVVASSQTDAQAGDFQALRIRSAFTPLSCGTITSVLINMLLRKGNPNTDSAMIHQDLGRKQAKSVTGFRCKSGRSTLGQKRGVKLVSSYLFIDLEVSGFQFLPSAPQAHSKCQLYGRYRRISKVGRMTGR